jgi:hypothetical protein
VGVKIRQCAQCRVEFEVGPWEHRNYAQRFCSRECGNANRSDHVRRAWPTEPEMRAMVFDEKLSDAEIGRRFGHSYEWARRVRNAYRIPALPKPPHREVKHGRYSGLHGWSVSAKGEDVCRACGRGPSGAGVTGRLHLHHVIPRSMCKATRADLRNGIPLCWDCHQGWHDRRVVIYRDVFTPDEWAFLTAVQLTGQEIGPWLDAQYPVRT